MLCLRSAGADGDWMWTGYPDGLVATRLMGDPRSLWSGCADPRPSWRIAGALFGIGAAAVALLILCLVAARRLRSDKGC